MTTANSSANKDNFKLIEVPLDKFHTEALPYHLQLYQQQKETIEKVSRNSLRKGVNNRIYISVHVPQEYGAVKLRNQKQNPYS